MLRDDLKSEFDALLPGRSTEAGATRRTALKAALGVGYAASTLPIMAQTAIKTSSEGLTAGEVTIDVNGFKMAAYRAAPAGKTGLPVVLVLSEIFGVHEYIADTARRFARAGYLAIAPELFERQGDAQSYGEMAKLHGGSYLPRCRTPRSWATWTPRSNGQRRTGVTSGNWPSPASAGAVARPGSTRPTTRT